MKFSTPPFKGFSKNVRTMRTISLFLLPDVSWPYLYGKNRNEPNNNNTDIRLICLIVHAPDHTETQLADLVFMINLALLKALKRCNKVTEVKNLIAKPTNSRFRGLTKGVVNKAWQWWHTSSTVSNFKATRLATITVEKFTVSPTPIC